MEIRTSKEAEWLSLKLKAIGFLAITVMARDFMVLWDQMDHLNSLMTRIHQTTTSKEVAIFKLKT